jgi:hypothetical protein
MTGFSSHDRVVQKGLDEMSERPLAKHFDIRLVVERKVELARKKITTSRLRQPPLRVLQRRERKTVFQALGHIL